MLIDILLVIASSSSSINFVDASGYKFSEKDSKPGKIKLKKQASGKGAKTGKLEPQGEHRESIINYTSFGLFLASVLSTFVL